MGEDRDLSLGVDVRRDAVTRDGMEELLPESLQAVSQDSQHRGGWDLLDGYCWGWSPATGERGSPASVGKWGRKRSSGSTR